MKFTAQQIADVLEGKIEGDASVEVWTLSKIEEGAAGSISFLANEKYTPYIYNTAASIVIVNQNFIPENPIKATLVKVEDSYGAFSKLLRFYDEHKRAKIPVGIDTNTSIDKTAIIGKDIYIAPFVSIGANVRIGDNVKIYANVTIAEDVEIGNNTIIHSGVQIYSDTKIGVDCTIHSGAVIGSDGFGFAPNQSGVYDKVPQIGNVIIEDYVDIGAATTIDRATMGATIIRKGVKLDNQIQIAHNVEVGENTVIAAQTGIAGSSKVGKNCMIGGQVGIVGHITIGDNVKVQAQTGIARNVKDNEVLQGTPALPYTDFNKSYVYFKKLPNLVDKIEKIDNRIKNIESDNG